MMSKLAERRTRRDLMKALWDAQADALVGKTICFEYPDHNYRRIVLRYQKRLMTIERARVFGSEPGDEEAARRDPLKRRLGKLVIGVDLADRDGTVKQFYYGSMRDIHEATAEEIAALRHPPQLVALVQQPSSWTPSSTSDVPPNVELHFEDGPHQAHSFTQGFNAEAMAAPGGWWAVAASSH